MTGHLSRRELLAGTAVAGAAAMIPRPVRAMHEGLQRAMRAPRAGSGPTD